MTPPARAVWIAAALVATLSCASSQPRVLRFDAPPRPQAGKPFPNWPIPPLEAERVLVEDAFEVVRMKGAGGGTTGARKMTLRFSSLAQEIPVKGKRIPGDLDGVNNAPRKELAAFAIQRLFFDPEDYVVPTTTVRCIETEVFNEYSLIPTGPTISGSACVLVVFALWIDDVTIPDELYEEERFLTDATYAYFMANLNLFTHLVDHRDGRSGNFMVSEEGPRQAFSIDNGISFGPLVYNFFVANWTELRVPALRRDSIERLRTLDREELDYLGTVTQLAMSPDGILRPVEPEPPFDEDEGARLRGTTVQFGLTKDEIDDVWERIEQLIEDVDAGQVQVF